VYRFLVVIEKAGGNYSAYAPDLPGCVATGKTLEETERNMHDAIRLHLQGLQEDGLPIPTPEAHSEYMAISVP
jgi:predicted RNase H-like HicB family nuclease